MKTWLAVAAIVAFAGYHFLVEAPIHGGAYGERHASRGRTYEPGRLLEIGPAADMPSVDAASPDTPNRQLTPGAVLPVTLSDLCVKGYTKTVRSVTAERHRHVFTTYGLTNYKGGYEVDHLVSLELGGSNSELNLWPETKHTKWNAFVKDRLENRLHSLVCSGKMPLAQAQFEIATNWIASYKRHISPTPQGETSAYAD